MHFTSVATALLATFVHLCCEILLALLITYKLACRQVEKIYRLRDIKGWNIHCLDATQVFKKKDKESDESWNELVAGPSVAIVGQSLSKTY